MKLFRFKIFIILGIIISIQMDAQENKPNIVVIMADDIGLGDIGYYHRLRTGKEPLAPTPNLDKIAKESMRFTDAHSPAPLCAPTRFSMITGNYSYRNQRSYGVWSPDADALIDSNNFTSVGRIAKKGGYTTAFFGKWGLGGSWVKKRGTKTDYTQENAGALTYGFDYALELPEGIQNKPYAFYENQKWMKLKPNSVLKDLDAVQTQYAYAKKHKKRGGIGDSNWNPADVGFILADKAVQYIEKQKQEKPFYMYYCSQAVHIPHAPPKTFNGEKIEGSTPGFHGDMIKELDLQVGMIVAALKKTGAYENTLFIFTSDNGGLTFDKKMTKAGHVTSNGLNGSKGSIFEGGHRVPFFAIWPRKIKPNTESNEPIIAHDIVATVAALSNQELDKTKVFDSANLLPYFLGKSDGKAHQYLMHQSAGGPTFAIRDGHFKLIMKGGSKKTGSIANINPTHLYNLSDNLNEEESKNLLDNLKYKDRVETMFAKFKELRVTKATTVN
ncbi:arylsulfatase [Polaribacter sp.]|nr:arylsulfatase [Polaribacter sp.]